ncbi:MAG: hypothetical protein JNK05_40955 [Myxococcales bacterium]|nr:hypothetical protein [Myxococcales bacterium]
MARPRLIVFASAFAVALAASSASAQTALEQVGDAFRTPALGVGGRATRATPQSGLSPLDSLDSTQHLNNADGPGAEHPSVHPTISALRGALWHWLDEPGRRRLMAVDAQRTSAADTQRVQLFLADRALRRFAPMALAMLSRRTEALALRGAPALRTLADADAVARNSVVQRIMRRREAVDVATASGFARRLIRLGASISPAFSNDEDLQFAADRAVVAAAEAARTRDAAEVALVIAETNIAYGSRAERSVVVDEAIHLIEEAVAIARGNPAVERPLPALPVSIDPDANVLPIGPAAQPTTVATRPAATRGRASRPRSGQGSASLVRRPGPDARCYDDFRCFQDEH